MFSQTVALCLVLSTHDTCHVLADCLIYSNTYFVVSAVHSCNNTVSLSGPMFCIVLLWQLSASFCALSDMHLDNLRKPMGQLYVLRKLWSAECVLVWAWFLVSHFHCYCDCILLCLVMLFNTIVSHCYFCCVGVVLIISHKIRLFGVGLLKGLGGYFVPSPLIDIKRRCPCGKLPEGSMFSFCVYIMFCNYLQVAGLSGENHVHIQDTREYI